MTKADRSTATTTCIKCGESKPANGFYESDPCTCKECTKARVRLRARTNPKVQEYDRKRAKSPGVRKRIQSVAREWRKKNPDAYKAQNAVSNAVRDGRLNKEPCLFCGATKVHAHHRDYSRPLDVIWLCPKCHHRLHAAFPETEGANKRSDGEVQA
jgi:ribosomal protein S27AE